jgi:hypothetical protein
VTDGAVHSRENIFPGINGLAGGLLLAVKSDGSLLGMQPDWLIRTPFQNYLIPGILLALFLGILPLLTFIGIIIRRNWKFTGLLNLYNDKHWGMVLFPLYRNYRNYLDNRSAYS